MTTNNKRFTSYDRSSATGLDYAINRTYDSKQGRFTAVDPISMQAASLVSLQTLNMYTYCGNDPVNYVDPSGLFFGALFKWIWKTIKIIVAAVLAAIAVLAFSMGLVFEGVHLALVSAQLFADTLGLKSLQKIISIASIAVSITRIRLMGVSTVPTFPLQGSGSGIDLRVLSFLGSVGSIASGFAQRKAKKRSPSRQDCTHWIADQMTRLKPFFDSVWKRVRDSRSQAAPNGLEQGGIAFMSTSIVSASGGFDYIGWDIFEGPTHPHSMGREFNEWVVEKRRKLGISSRGDYLTIVVHAHPGEKIPVPSGWPRNARPGQKATADFSFAHTHDEAVLGADAIVVFSSSGVRCTLKRP